MASLDNLARRRAIAAQKMQDAVSAVGALAHIQLPEYPRGRFLDQTHAIVAQMEYSATVLETIVRSLQDAAAAKAAAKKPSGASVVDTAAQKALIERRRKAEEQIAEALDGISNLAGVHFDITREVAADPHHASVAGLEYASAALSRIFSQIKAASEADTPAPDAYRVAAVPQTVDEALQFFHEFGNVGRDIQQMRLAMATERPSAKQLDEACIECELRGQTLEAIKTARRLIEETACADVAADPVPADGDTGANANETAADAE